MNTYEIVVGNRTINIELNKFAKQADGSLMITYGDTSILCTAVESKRKNNLDFFPLVINYEEKIYSLGKIPGNYPRREARPSDNATLAARLIDRPIRPLFPADYKNEIQIVCTVMSLDQDNDPTILSIIGASLSLMLAKNIPFNGPIASVCVGLIDGEFIINPTVEQREKSELDLKLAGTKNEINMVEASANEISEELILEAIMFGFEEIKKIVTWQEKVINELEIIKDEYVVNEDEEFNNIKKKINDNFSIEIKNALKVIDKTNRINSLSNVMEEIKLKYSVADEDENIEKYKKAFSEIEKEIFRSLIIENKHRVDGRKIDEIRKLSSETNVLPRVHGSSLFTRGETQALAIVTLGVKSDEQMFDGLEIEKTKNFLLHYNFPPYSVGETGRMGAPGRREIGHGHLAEMAIKPMLPTLEEFPYTIRVVSEILESNGSSSQATICATSMALMSAGVNLKKQVAGIAMGLIADEKEYTILSDIQGLEDHLGDMDFKVAGTKDGITALQMDIKIDGISKKIFEESLSQAKKGRLELLEHLNATIDIPNKEVSECAPKMITMNIEVAQIKDVIGKGGDTINKIIEQTNVKIDIEEDGKIFIYGTNKNDIEKAIEIIERLTKTYKVGDVYQAKVVRIESYGAFVRFDGQEGLLHISDLSDKRVEKVEDVIKMNEEIQVSIKEIDMKKRIKVKLITSQE